MPSKNIHVAGNGKILCFFFFLRLSSIPLYVWKSLFFIHSSVGGHFSYFQVFAIVNNAAMNIVVPISFRISVFVFGGCIYPGVQLQSYVVLFLLFLKASILFSTVAAPTYIPTNSTWGFPFLHILTSICYLYML